MFRQLFHMEHFLHFHEFYVLKSQIFIKDISCMYCSTWNKKDPGVNRGL